MTSACRMSHQKKQFDSSSTGLSPPISALSDRWSIFTVGIFHSWDFLHRSRRSQIGGVFSLLGFFHSLHFLHGSRCSQIGGVFPSWDFFAIGTSSICFSALRSGECLHRWDFFTVGTFSTDLGALRSGEHFHSWKMSHVKFQRQFSPLFFIEKSPEFL